MNKNYFEPHDLINTTYNIIIKYVYYIYILCIGESFKDLLIKIV